MKKEKRDNEFVMLVITVVTIFSFLISICNTFFTSKYHQELNSYPKDDYLYLDDIAKKVVKENHGIDLSVIYEEIDKGKIVKYESSCENNETILTCYVNNVNSGSWLETETYLRLTLSENYTVIDRKHTFSSEEDYVRNQKRVISMVSFFISYMIIFVSHLIFCVIRRLKLHMHP